MLKLFCDRCNAEVTNDSEHPAVPDLSLNYTKFNLNLGNLDSTPAIPYYGIDITVAEEHLCKKCALTELIMLARAEWNGVS